MSLNVNLVNIAEMVAPDRTFLSIYLAGPHSVNELDKKLNKLRLLLKSDNIQKDELEYFEENIKTVEEYLKKNPIKSGSLCIFACKEIDYFETISIPEILKDIIRIDSKAYIRPLAEFYDDYENVAVVVANNESVHIFLVSSSVIGTEEVIKGNIKNHVKVGGWSQKRYQRRRDNQLSHYAKEITETLANIDKEESIGHVLLVGSKETLHSIHESMNKEWQNKVIEKNLDLSKADNIINKDIMELLAEEEQRFQLDYWENIKTEYLRGGLAVVGIDNVLQAVEEKRIDRIIIDKTLHPLVERCQVCDNLITGDTQICPVCGSKLIFKVSIVNDILELLIQSGGEYHFVDSIAELKKVGGIAALLRY